jgi:hypothetical protein
VDGRLPGADTAGAVRFESLSQMLAWLVADIVSGRAQKRWYWQQWMRLLALSNAEAIASLLSEHAERLPEIIVQLEQIPALSEVWRTLSPEGAEQLLMEVSRVTQMQLYGTIELKETPDASNHPLQAGSRFAEIVRAPNWPAIVRRWRDPLSNIEIHDARYRLAAALIALETFPVYLRQQPAGCVAVTALVLQEYAQCYLPPVQRKRALPIETAAESPKDGRQHRSSPIPVTTGADSQEQLYAPLSTHSIHTSENIMRMQLHRTSETRGSLEDRSDRQPGSTKALHQWKPQDERVDRPGGSIDAITGDRPIIDPSFHTRQGGLFYLINALNHPSICAVLDDREAWTMLPSGWAWLFRLGECLGLDPDDPVVQFLARETGFDTVDQLLEVPGLPLRERLMTLLDDLYACDVWQPQLLKVDARVVPTASHLDVEFPMSAVRLPVRLAGLDLNPGWVPWLGRVVTFHYTAQADGGSS